MAELYPVSKIEENPWNPNQMSADKYEAMREDMKLGGPAAIDPILIASKRAIFKDPSIPEDIRITINGNHRLRLARELGWRKIRGEFTSAIDSEEKARVISYAKNAERGEMDPYRLPEYFRWFVDHRWTHERIAKEHKLDRTTVTKYLSVCKIDSSVKEKLADVPRLTISHLEPISTLRHNQQRQLADKISKEYKREPPSVKRVEQEVKWVKDEERRRKEAEREAEKLKKAVEKAKFPNCPICGKPPTRADYEGLPKVSCENGHDWNLKTGKMPAWQERRAKPKKPEIPKYIRTTHTLDAFRELFCVHARSLIPSFKRIDTIRCDGTADSGKEAHVSADLDPYRQTISLRVELDGQDFSLMVEPKTYKKEDLKKFKTSVSIFPEPKRKQDLVKLEQRVEELFEKFGHEKKGGR